MITERSIVPVFSMSNYWLCMKENKIIISA